MVSGGGLLSGVLLEGFWGRQSSVGQGQGDLAACNRGVAHALAQHRGTWPPLVHMAEDFLSPDWS